MILFIGQVARNARDREGFQEVDFRAMFAPLAKWAAEIDDPSRIPEYVARAFRTAMAGRAGPVVLSLPEDMLSELVIASSGLERIEPVQSAPAHEDLEKFAALASIAERPLIIVGGSGWTETGAAAMRTFATENKLPLVSSFRRQDIVDNGHDVYCGHLGLGVDAALAERLRAADLVISIGSRLGENTTGGYSLLTPPNPVQKLIHIHPDPEEIGRVYQPQLGIACSPDAFARSLSGMRLAGGAKRSDWLKNARGDYIKFSTPPSPEHDCVDLAAVVASLSELGDEMIVTNGAGNYTVWVHRFFRYRNLRTELASTSGAMGYGIPAAIAAKLRHPDRTVVAFAGDGCFLMYPQELATAVQHQANIIVLVANNGMYGTIRMHQERRYPGRAIGTDLSNPDFVALAHSFGVFAERVERTSDFASAFERALAAGKPALLDLSVDPLQISPGMRLKSVARPLAR